MFTDSSDFDRFTFVCDYALTRLSFDVCLPVKFRDNLGARSQIGRIGA